MSIHWVMVPFCLYGPGSGMDYFLTYLSHYSNLCNLAGETYRQTDADFLDSERDTFRDDGSTASTAVLVDNHLYVANVGDSRTIISKAGKGIFQMSYNILISSYYNGFRNLYQISEV